jgi:hypothetical protein
MTQMELPAPLTATTRRLYVALALTTAVLAAITVYARLGLPPALILGGSAVVGTLLWRTTYLDRPTDPAVILPLFLLTVAALEVHMIEEYLARFGPAMSRLFNIGWPEKSFLLVFAFAGPIVYLLTALGLYRRVRIAGVVACFIFVGPGVAEFTHFIFPLLRPAVLPDVATAISQTVGKGTFVADMPNYYVGTTGRYYFAGLYTAILPMIPGIYAIRRLWQNRAKAAT